MDAEATGARGMTAAGAQGTLTDPLVDRLLDGRYSIEARLARGGMASVYVATDVRLERRVAVKVMHAALADDPEFVARFNREARAAARLSHPDAVSVYDQGSDAGHVFLVMEYVPGATLRDVLRSRRRFSPAEALAVMDHVLAALGAAHAAGLVHRDVKPENVLVTADGRVKVADFGLARAVAGTSLTTDDTVLLGTAAYLAPEQVSEGVADERSDVYSAGVLLFELLTGTTPFKGDNAVSVAYQHVSDDVPAPSSRVSGIPREIDALVASATARNPDARPADGRVLHAALEDVRDRLRLHGAVPTPGVDLTVQIPRAGAATTVLPPAGPGHPTAALPPMPPAGDEPPRRRRRRWPWVLALVTLLAALGGLAGWWFAVGGYTRAPSVISMSRAAAEKELQSEGLKWRYAPAVFSDSIDKGAIATQDPGAGDRVDKGATITLAVSRGPSEYDVPDVHGESVDAATADLKAVSFKVGKTKHSYSDTIATGLVIRTEPPSGTPLHVGTAVTLVVSRGVQPVPIPDVAGEDVAKATHDLTKAGFQVGTTTEAFSDTVADGKVIRTEPAGGAKAQPGATINLVVSKGPELFEVPNVVGQKIDDAIRAINEAGFHARPSQIFPAGPGKVVRQTPSGMQRKGTTIELDYF